MNSPEYEEYRRAVFSSLENYIREIREDIHSLQPIFGRIFEETKKVHSKGKNKLSQLKPSLVLKALQDTSRGFLRGILRQTKKFDDAKHRIFVEKSIFVVGAGLSFESDVPMTEDLSDLLLFNGASGYSDLRNDPTKCYNFKNSFKKLISNHKPGKSHMLIAENFPDKIGEIICLNWDDMIEKAFAIIEKDSKKVNKDLPTSGKHHLWKFHGDVQEFNTMNIAGNLGWIFPDEGGYVFSNFEKYVSDSKLKKELFTIFIVGYSESDVQVESVVTSLEKSPPRPTYRVGMSLGKVQNEFYLLGPAPYVLERVLT